MFTDEEIKKYRSALGKERKELKEGNERHKNYTEDFADGLDWGLTLATMILDYHAKHSEDYIKGMMVHWEFFTVPSTKERKKVIEATNEELAEVYCGGYLPHWGVDHEVSRRGLKLENNRR